MSLGGTRSPTQESDDEALNFLFGPQSSQTDTARNSNEEVRPRFGCRSPSIESIQDGSDSEPISLRESKDQGQVDENDCKHNINIKQEIPDARFPWTSTGSNPIDLSNDNSSGARDSQIKLKAMKIPSKWTHMENSVINLSDDEGRAPSSVKIKTESTEFPFQWTEMSDDTIEISDGDEEAFRTFSPKPQSRSPTSSNHEATHASRLIESPQPSASDDLRHLATTGAGAIFKGSRRGPTGSEKSTISNNDDNGTSSDEEYRYVRISTTSSKLTIFSLVLEKRKNSTVGK